MGPRREFGRRRHVRLRRPMLMERLVLVAAAGLIPGCGAQIHNFDSTGPIFRSPPVEPESKGAVDSFRVTTYNIKFGERVREAIEDLSYHTIDSADVLLLQEVDYSGAREIANAFDMHFAYGPASIHYKSPNGWFGNAILSRWPMTDEALHEMPGFEWNGQRRMPLSAVLTLETPWGRERVLVCSVHTATVAIGLSGQRAQWGAIRDAMDVRRCELGIDRVVVGGDFNTGLPGSGLHAGFWSPCFHDVTEDVERTSEHLPPCCGGKLDHIFAAGFNPSRATRPERGSGTGSDHYPISAVLCLPEEPDACSLPCDEQVEG